MGSFDSGFSKPIKDKSNSNKKYGKGDKISYSAVERYHIPNINGCTSYFNKSGSVWYQGVSSAPSGILYTMNKVTGAVSSQRTMNDWSSMLIKNDGSGIGRSTSFDGSSNSSYDSHLVAFNGSTFDWTSGTTASGSQNSPPSCNPMLQFGNTNPWEGSSYVWAYVAGTTNGQDGWWICNWSGVRQAVISPISPFYLVGYHPTLGYLLSVEGTSGAHTLVRRNVQTGGYVSQIALSTAISGILAVWFDTGTDFVYIVTSSNTYKINVTTAATVVSVTNASMGLSALYITGDYDSNHFMAREYYSGQTYTGRLCRIRKSDLTFIEEYSAAYSYMSSSNLSLTSECACDNINNIIYMKTIGKLGLYSIVKII